MYCVLRKAYIIILLLLSVSSFSQEVIFDSKTLKGWSGNDMWSVEDGAITAGIPDGQSLNKNEFLYFNEELSDFELNLDYKITGPGANSGIQFRSIKDQSGHAAGYQADLDDGRTWLGRIYDEHGRGLILERGQLVTIGLNGEKHSFPFRDAKELGKVAKKNDWNHYRIVARGHRVEIYINGVHFSTLEDYEKGKADLKGLIALQLHSGKGPAKLQFKNITLKRFKQQLTESKQEVGKVPEDFPNINFEKGDLSGWTAEGTAFEKQPVKKGVISARKKSQPSKAEGKYFVGTYEIHLNDSAKGTLTSKAFKITHNWAEFRVGGGSTNDTRAEIVLKEGNKVIGTFSGKNTETMSRQNIDLRNHINKEIYIRLVDNSSEGWGHINFDGFKFYNNLSSAGIPNSSPILRHLEKNPPDTNKDASTTHKMFVPKGFKVETIASSKEVRQPISFTFDSKGRIWIAEAYAYPRRQPEGKGKDRLIILEDTDGDGKFETHKVFADNLNLISGFEIGYGGVWVAAAPQMLFIPDKDGDDKPDGEYEVLLDGWDTNDTHETPNSFTWGMDGWLYGCHGVFNNSFVGKPGTPRDKRIRVNAAIWRLHPVSKEFEIYSRGGSNQWGMDYNADGEIFMTHCRSSWGRGPVSQVLRDGHYWTQNNSNHAEFVATPKKGWNFVNAALNNTLFSAAAYGHGQGGAGNGPSRGIFGGHSHVGTMVYLGDNWPEEYRNNLYTNNLHGKQLNREFIQRFDSGYLAHSYGRDQLYVEDNEYLAVSLRYGPDGAVYSIDWSDKQHCHVNNWNVWDRTNGAVYRMQWQETFKPVLVKDVASLENSELVKLLDHSNEWYSRMAQHNLRQRAAKGKIDSESIAQIRQKLTDTNYPNRFRALVALYGVNGIDKELYEKLLSDDNDVIRAQTVHLITEQDISFSSTYSDKFIEMAKSDPSSMVRLKLAGACQKRIEDSAALKIIEILAKKQEDSQDRFIPKMLWFAYSKFAKKDINEAYKLADVSPLPLFRKSVYWYSAKHNIDHFLTKVGLEPNNERLSEYLLVLSQVLEGKKKVQAPTSWLAVQKRAEKIDSAKQPLSALMKVFDQNSIKVDETKEQIARGKAAFALCAACHNPGKDMPGPSLEEVASVYDNKEDIIKWVIKPGKKRTKYPQMPPFDKMSRESLEDIAAYLLSLRKPQIISFKKQVLSTEYYSEGANFADFNKDGKIDIVSGPFWYEAPEFTKKHEIYPVKAFSKTSGYANSFFTFPYDFNKDGWTDVLAWGLPGSPAFIYENPQGKEGHWKAHKVFPHVGHESPNFVDIDKDGKPELICTYKWKVGYATWDTDNPFSEWKWHAVGHGRFAHGLGYGDINNDGRIDLIGPQGWWEQPSPITAEWKFHNENFGANGAQIYSYDVDGDGDNDVISSLAAHGWGLAWFEQTKDKKFVRHVIMGSRPEDNLHGVKFSQLHALELYDMNGDGLKDIVTGKCYFAHNGGDPGAKDPAVMSWFELKRKDGKVIYTPHFMDSDSGLGRLIAVGDINADGKPDVVSANKKGAFVFTQTRKEVSSEEFATAQPALTKPIQKTSDNSLLIEGEKIQVIKNTGNVSVQNMSNWASHKWSNDAQLWWTGAKPGDQLDMKFDVKNARKYKLAVNLTKANDYGKVEIYLNGQKIGGELDLYDQNVVNSGQINLADLELKAGTQNISFKITGANPKAKKSYMVGIDCIKLIPLK